MNKTVLITGGLGFIPSHLIKFLLKNYDYKIVNLDSCTYAANRDLINQENKDSLGNMAVRLGKFYGGDYFHYGDIVNKENLDRVFSADNIDLVVHCCAESHVDNSIKNSQPFMNTNIIGTLNILEKCREFKVPLIHISTDETIKHTKPISLPLGLTLFNRLKEDANFDPSSPYSASKAAAEMLCNAWKKTYGMDVRVIRMTNNYGPFQHFEKLVPKTINRALFNQKIPIYGAGLQWRDWLYVEDTVKAISLIIEKGKLPIYHIAANNERRNIDIVKTILKKVGRSEKLLEFVDDRPAHDFSYSLDCSLIKKELGWKPEVSFDEGLEKTISFYENNIFNK